MKRRVLLYETKDGKSPVREFILALPVKVQREIAKILLLLEEVDLLLEPYFKKLVNTDIWEVRKRFGSNSYRILFFFDEDSIVILTNGFSKKTKKTPKNEILKAQRFKEDYMRRKK